MKRRPYGTGSTQLFRSVLYAAYSMAGGHCSLASACLRVKAQMMSGNQTLIKLADRAAQAAPRKPECCLYGLANTYTLAGGPSYLAAACFRAKA